MIDVLKPALALALLAPLVTVSVIGVWSILSDDRPSEERVTRIIGTGLGASVLGSVLVLARFLGLLGAPVRGDIDFGDWLRIDDFFIPAVLLIDQVSVSISLFAAFVTALIARFSRTYLHKEAGFIRFFTLLAIFATGTQLVAFAGALELFFAGWELLGISSAFFIGFFHERAEPVRSSIRAFATYRLSDAGLLIATVATLQLLGTARFSAFGTAAALPPLQATAVALLFLISAMGKSAQLPFSGWLPRAMEGPTPSSALFYGAVSIHAGLFLLLRVWPLLEVSMVARSIGVAVGLSTAVYATLVVRVHTDAKGALAHATLSQVGLILAEICLGWTSLALAHLICHAFLRLGQYLKAPNTIHDSHRLGHATHSPSWLDRLSPGFAARVYAASLHRLRLDDRIDQAFAPVMWLATTFHRVDVWWRRVISLDRTDA
ncbi:MAG: proton-conducting membrane transporter [Gemmatimonadaceae bacterium]|nr:proton-conducting membrane transporter [Gemmatimonadaceae bacterium]